MLGVSVDSVPCKVAWAASLGGVPFDLLSDFFPQGEVARRYGVLRDGGISERALFLVDRRGRLTFTRTYVIGTQPANAEVFEALETLTD